MELNFTNFVKLGTNRKLSKYELSVVLEKIPIQSTVYLEWRDYLFFKLNQQNTNRYYKLLNNSGSIVKSGNIFFDGKLEEKTWIEAFRNQSKIIFDKFSKSKTRIKFVINIQGKPNKKREEILSILKAELRNISKTFREPIKVLPTKKGTFELSPLQYYKENIPRRGHEINCFLIEERIILAFTIWVTNPIKDIKQDKERPIRFFTHGTSIKLSRTLVNIAKIPENGVLLDPFCGTGTILLEALKQKIKVIGVDKDPKCIRATKENLNHFSMKFDSKEKMKDKWTVYQKDSREINNIIKEQLDGIVTEPYLGPFLKRLPEREKAQKIINDLEKLYLSVIRQSISKLKKGGLVVFIIPEYRYSKNKKISIDYLTLSKNCSLKLQMESEFFNVELPINIGREHNILNRKLIILQKEGKTS
ncbi:MAG: TRM11 family SAM-dependent methyltransferase [Candidatus Heimdallarchaeaceae archaeon]